MNAGHPFLGSPIRTLFGDLAGRLDVPCKQIGENLRKSAVDLRFYGRCTSQRFPGELVTAGRSHKSHFALTAKIGGAPRFMCSTRTSLAVNSAMNGAGAAAFSTFARPPASCLSTRHNTPL